jgi:hypothetical protein
VYNDFTFEKLKEKMMMNIDYQRVMTFAAYGFAAVMFLAVLFI